MGHLLLPILWCLLLWRLVAQLQPLRQVQLI
jgi:hypothetical protein